MRFGRRKSLIMVARSFSTTVVTVRVPIAFHFQQRVNSMLRTLRSDTKINILNPNLDAKMFMKGVQTYLESIISVPFVPNKRMLWLALRTLKG